MNSLYRPSRHIVGSGSVWLLMAMSVSLAAHAADDRHLAEDDAAWVARYAAGGAAGAATDPGSSGRAVTRSELGGLIGRSLRCLMRDGRTREGVLVAVDGATLTLQSRVAGGAFRVPVRAETVRRFIVD